MLCERCKKREATYYYRENVNGAVKEYHLCTECMKELDESGGINHFTKDSLFDAIFGGDVPSAFTSLFAPAVRKGQSRLPTTEKCSLCGASFEEIAREGKVGCPKCYEVFEGELAESIRAIHGRGSHTGGAPMKQREVNEAKRKMESLEAELRAAVQSENYERAAELRDELRALRGETEKGEGENG